MGNSRLLARATIKSQRPPQGQLRRLRPVVHKVVDDDHPSIKIEEKVRVEMRDAHSQRAAIESEQSCKLSNDDE